MAEVWLSSVQSNGSGGLSFSHYGPVRVVSNNITSNFGDGLSLSGSESASGIIGNVITNHSGVAVEVAGASTSSAWTLSGNDIYPTMIYELRNDSGVPVIANGNYWGSVTTTELQAGAANLTEVYDKKDNSNVGAVIISTWSVSVLCSAPQITTQPQNITSAAGATAVFSVSATGSASLVYQWALNGVTLFNSAHITGANFSTLTILSIGNSDAGSYSVVVSNPAGFVTSQAAALSVSTVIYLSADNSPADMQIVLNEAIAYGSAWKRGSTWPRHL